jgi:hypothetical protein
MKTAKKIRDSLIKRVGCCEICGTVARMHNPLCCHEIANGPCRSLALDKLFAMLVVCWRCNGELCDKASWPETRQLAVLRLRRPQDYDLAAYNQLVNPRAPDRIREEEVQ